MPFFVLVPMTVTKHKGTVLLCYILLCFFDNIQQIVSSFSGIKVIIRKSLNIVRMIWVIKFMLNSEMGKDTK